MNPRRLGSRIWTAAFLLGICQTVVLADEALNEELAVPSGYGDEKVGPPG